MCSRIFANATPARGERREERKTAKRRDEIGIVPPDLWRVELGVKMNDYVWVSNALAEVSLIGKLETDIWVNDQPSAILAQKANEQGQPVAQEMCPRRVWGDDQAPFFEKLPDLISAQAHWIVSARAADILGQFDLGQGALYPISEGVFQADNVTPVMGDYFTWNFGATKTGLVPDRSQGLRPAGISGRVFKCPWKMSDECVCVSANVTSDSDVWLDPALFQSLFLSRELGDALDNAKLRKAFRLYKALVI